MSKQIKITDIFTNNNIKKIYDVQYKDDEKYKKLRASFKFNGETIRFEKSYLKLTKEDALKLLEDKVNNYNGVTSHKNEICLSMKDHFKNTIYNEEQIKFINSTLENSSLLGIPGGGKTQSIIGKIIHHYLKKDIIKSYNYKVYTFSRRACSDFISKGSKYDKKLFSKLSIQTIHSLASSLIKFVLNKASIQVKVLILAAYNLFETNSEIYNEKLKEYTRLKDCKIIFIDEAQDVSEIEYKFIKKISSFYNIPLIMVGDPNQNIYQFKKGSDKFLLNHSLKKYFLIKNYRSTPSIINIINKLRPNEDLTQLIIATRDDNNFKPTLIVDSIENIIKDIIHKIQNSNIPYHKMAIIGPVKNSKPIYNTYNNIGLSIFTNILKNIGIKYVKHYNDGDSDGYDINKNINIEDNAINILTVHGSKGLEFDTVFLLNFHHNTMGINPSLEEFNNFKYLWYVGVSRAENQLYLYTDENKNICESYKLILNDIVLQNKCPKQLKDIKFNESVKPLIYGVTDFLKNYLIDDKYIEYQNIIGEIEIKKDYLWEFDKDMPSLVIKEDISKIYGIFFEYIFNYYYSKNYSETPVFINEIETRIKNLIELPEKYKYGYIELKKILKELIISNITINSLLEYKSSFNKNSVQLIEYLLEETNNDRNREIYIILKNDVISHPKEKIVDHLDIIKKYFKDNINEEDLYKKIFFLTIYKYQCENEASYMLSMNFDNDIETLIPYILKIKIFAKDLYYKNKSSGDKYIYEFQKNIIHRNLPIKGIIDIINEDTIVDLKFSTSQSLENYIDQVIMYYLIYDNSLVNKKSLELWNLYNGERIIINLNLNNINKKNLLSLLGNTINEKLTNMIFFYDLETSGLIDNTIIHGYNYINYPDIIEIYIEEYNSKSVWCNSLVTLQTVNYLSPIITDITGITQNDLDLEGKNIDYIKNEIKLLLNICKDPVFIAHNGNRFDHRIMKYNKIFDEEMLLLDSMSILNLYINSKNIIGSQKLEKIYQYYFEDDVIAHRAKADVHMLIKIFEKNEIFDNLIQYMV